MTGCKTSQQQKIFNISKNNAPNCSQQTIMQMMADQGMSDFYVVFTMSLCALGLKQLLISLLLEIIQL